MKLSEIDVQTLIKKILAVAENHRRAAAMNGAMGDDGAAELEKHVEAFQCGLNQTVPPCWLKYATAIKNEADPEWEEFQRLKAKFGGK